MGFLWERRTAGFPPGFALSGPLRWSADQRTAAAAGVRYTRAVQERGRRPILIPVEGRIAQHFSLGWAMPMSGESIRAATATSRCRSGWGHKSYAFTVDRYGHAPEEDTESTPFDDMDSSPSNVAQLEHRTQAS